MVSYLQSGQGKQATTKWGGGAGACKTEFKTHMSITSSSGKKRSYTKSKGEFIWEKVEPGDKIRYNVFTGADDKKGKSDEYYLIASTLNWPYLIQLYNEINRNATDSQKQEWEANPDAFEKYMYSKIDESRIMLTITSKMNKTDSDGTEHKILNIPNTWPSGPIQLAFIYGYDNDARSSDSSRMWTNIIDVVGWVGFAVAILMYFTICAGLTIATVGGAGVACIAGVAIVGASIVADIVIMAEMAYEQYTQGILTQIGRNKYGCSFPEGGYVQLYSIFLSNPSVDPFLQIDVSAAQANPVTTSGTSANLLNSRLLLIIGVSVGLFLTIWNILGGESDEQGG